MSERLGTLKKARERMLEDRDSHAKVLAAPFDRDKAERARNKFIELQLLVELWIAPSVGKRPYQQRPDIRDCRRLTGIQRWRSYFFCTPARNLCAPCPLMCSGGTGKRQPSMKAARSNARAAFVMQVATAMTTWRRPGNSRWSL